jgi:hypothetical protein
MRKKRLLIGIRAVVFVDVRAGSVLEAGQMRRTLYFVH